MKRRLRIIAIFLLLGAVVNVAVAWGCALWLDISKGEDRPGPGGTWVRYYTSSEELPYWFIDWHERSGAVRYFYSAEFRKTDYPPGEGVCRVCIPRWSAIYSEVPPDKGRDVQVAPGQLIPGSLIEDARGWPMLSLWCSFRVTTTPGLDLYAAGVEGGIPISHRSDFEPTLFAKAYPLRPIWSGVAGNTISYAGLLWLLIRGPFALRRFLRVRRSLCPKCAYPMGESAVCTECGIALPRRGSMPNPT